MRGRAYPQQKREEVAWDLAEGFSIRRTAERNNVPIATVALWNVDPDFQDDIAACRLHLAKQLGDATLTRISNANSVVVAALNGELDLTDPATALKVSLADKQLARSIDQLFSDPDVAVGFLRGAGQPNPQPVPTLPTGRAGGGDSASS